MSTNGEGQESAQSAIATPEVFIEAKEEPPLTPTRIRYEVDGVIQYVNVESGRRHRIPVGLSRQSAKYMLFRFKNSTTMYWAVRITETKFGDWETADQPQELVDAISAYGISIEEGNEQEDLKIIMLV